MVQKKKKVAVFDIDGTIFRSSLLVELTEELIEEGLIPNDARKKYEKELIKWQHRDGHYDDYIQRVVDVYMEYVTGLPIDRAIEVSQRVVAVKSKRVYRYTRSLIEHLRGTHFLLAISHSPHYIVKPFAEEMGFDKTYAMWYEQDEKGLLTGIISNRELILNKGKILQRAIEKEQLIITDSYGVGDSEGDILMLDKVTHPIAFNPSKGLYNEAKKKGWKIIVERKDVIYEDGIALNYVEETIQ